MRQLSHHHPRTALVHLVIASGQSPCGARYASQKSSQAVTHKPPALLCFRVTTLHLDLEIVFFFTTISFNKLNKTNWIFLSTVCKWYPVLRSMWAGEDGTTCVLQNPRGPGCAWVSVFTRKQTTGHSPLWRQRVPTTLAGSRLGKGEQLNFKFKWTELPNEFWVFVQMSISVYIHKLWVTT